MKYFVSAYTWNLQICEMFHFVINDEGDSQIREMFPFVINRGNTKLYKGMSKLLLVTPVDACVDFTDLYVCKRTWNLQICEMLRFVINGEGSLKIYEMLPFVINGEGDTKMNR